MSKRFYRILKIGLIGFISAISLLLVVGLAFDIHDHKLYLHIFPRPALYGEALENYWQNPLPPPKAIQNVVTQMKNGDSFYVDIVAAEVWVPGDEDPDVYYSVQASFELYIDGIYQEPRYIAQSLAVFSGNKAGEISTPVST